MTAVMFGRVDAASTVGRPVTACGKSRLVDECQLAQRTEGGPQLLREEPRFLPSGEVTALVHLVEVDDVGVRLLDPAARGPPDLPGERREADWNRDRRWSLAGRT